MEIGTLLLIRRFPRDVVMDIYKHLCHLKRIPKELKDDIETFSLWDQLTRNYALLFEDDPLTFLMVDLVLFEFMVDDKDSFHDISLVSPGTTRKLWIALSPENRTEFHRLSLHMLDHPCRS